MNNNKKALHRSAMPGNKRSLPSPERDTAECYSCTTRRATERTYGGRAGACAMMQVPDDFTGFAAIPGKVGGEDVIFQFAMLSGEIMAVMPFRSEDIERVAGALLAAAEAQRAAPATDVTPLSPDEPLVSGQAEASAIG